MTRLDVFRLSALARFHPERQVILLSAGIEARRRDRREWAARLLAEIRLPGLCETLRLRKLLPTLGPRILEFAEQSTSNFAAEVERAVAAGRRQGTFLQLATLHIMAVLADAGIRSTPLKGPLLSQAIYGDIGRRVSADIDLLVATEQLQPAVDVLRQLGYGAPTDHVEDRGLPLLHFMLLHDRGGLPPVELHWRIHWYEHSFARERLLPPAVDPSGDWRPTPADELAALLLFFARDGFIDLRLASDLSGWWDTYGADLPPGALDELLGAYPALARVLPAAAEVAERIVGLPVTQIFGGMPKLDLRERMAVRLANPNPHSSQSQLYADMGLIDGLLMPSGDLGAFIRRHLFPPREVLNAHARRRARGRARWRLSRCAGVLARYGLTMTRLARTPETLC